MRKRDAGEKGRSREGEKQNAMPYKGIVEPTIQVVEQMVDWLKRSRYLTETTQIVLELSLAYLHQTSPGQQPAF